MELTARENQIYSDGIKTGLRKLHLIEDHAILVVAHLLLEKKGSSYEKLSDEKKAIYREKAKKLLHITPYFLGESDEN